VNNVPFKYQWNICDFYFGKIEKPHHKFVNDRHHGFIGSFNYSGRKLFEKNEKRGRMRIGMPARRIETKMANFIFFVFSFQRRVDEQLKIGAP
jgi:hypothetical protein